MSSNKNEVSITVFVNGNKISTVTLSGCNMPSFVQKLDYILANKMALSIGSAEKNNAIVLLGPDAVRNAVFIVDKQS